MPRVVVDTNVLSAYFRGDDAIANKLDGYDGLVIPYVVAAELMAGYEYGGSSNKNLPILRNFLATDGIELLYPTDETLNIYAELFAFLKKSGTPIPINDVWIAAVTIQIGFPLYTLDSDFKNLPQLRLVQN